MTDPFKNQRYSYNQSYPNEFLPMDPKMYSSMASSTLRNTPSSPDLRNRLNMQLKELNDVSAPPANPNQEAENKPEFIQAFVHSNKDVLKQLKSNNELLFKGAK